MERFEKFRKILSEATEEGGLQSLAKKAVSKIEGASIDSTRYKDGLLVIVIKGTVGGKKVAGEASVYNQWDKRYSKILKTWFICNELAIDGEDQGEPPVVRATNPDDFASGFLKVVNGKN